MAKVKKLMKKTLFDYRIRNDDTVVVCDFLGNPNVKKLTIPNKINGYDVTDISGDALDNCKNLETLAFPEKLNYLNASLMSNLRKLKCVIINNPDAEVECDTFVSNTQLKYIILHKKLYNKIANDDYPCISGKVSFDKYGINPRITQMIPFDSNRTSTLTANNMIEMYHDALLAYNLQLDLFERLKTAFNKSNVLLFDEQGNSESTIAAYNYVNENIRNALSASDTVIINFYTEFAKALSYDDYNSFETFEKKINECLYIIFINAVESNRLSSLRQWIDVEFQRYNFVHEKRNESVVIFFNYIVRRLSEFFFEIQNPSFTDLFVVTSYLFSNNNITDDDVYRLIEYINKINLKEQDESSFSKENAQMCAIYTENKQFTMDEAVSRCMLWGYYNYFFNVSDFIDFYYSVEEIEETDLGKELIDTIKSAMEKGTEIPLVMDLLTELSDNDGKINNDKLQAIQASITKKSYENQELSINDVDFDLTAEDDVNSPAHEPLVFTENNADAVSEKASTPESEIKTKSKNLNIDTTVKTENPSNNKNKEAHSNHKSKKNKVKNNTTSNGVKETSEKEKIQNSNESESDQLLISENGESEKFDKLFDDSFVNDDPLDISLVKDIE